MIPFEIEGRLIGPGLPTFVIAEIGVNHDGSAQKAIELVRMAANSGAAAIKLQIFRATTLLHSSSMLAAYQKDRARETNPADMLRKYELSLDDLRRVVKAAREARVIPLATTFSPSDVEVAEMLRLPAIKIASPDLVNRPLLQRVAQAGKPVILSTGGAELAEIDTTAAWMKSQRLPYSLLHCISAYPTPAAQANLCWIPELAARYDVPIGYSDHTTEVITGALAAAAGACIVERHLTYDRAAKGPDHAASSDPAQFERYAKMVREADVLRGTPGKRVLEIEQDVRKTSRQSLVAKRGIRAGDVIAEEDLTVQRPGSGISAAYLGEIVGCKALKPIAPGAMLQPDMVATARALSEVA